MLRPLLERTLQSMKEHIGNTNGAKAVIVRIEHPVPDYDSWKRVFDAKGPELRTRHGARSYQVLRPIDDPRYVMIDLDFGSQTEAEGFVATMRQLWSGSGREVSSNQRARIATTVERK
jgi:hypothetical protein